MSLTPEQIKLLLSKPAAKPKSPSGKTIDTSVRTYETWFKLAHKLFDETQPDGLTHCSNPNCVDTRNKERILVVHINGVDMCRLCFLDGYMEIDPKQGELT